MQFGYQREYWNWIAVMKLVVNQHNGKYPGTSLHAVGTTDLLLHIPEIQSHAF
jgi:hypothetical protein